MESVKFKTWDTERKEHILQGEFLAWGIDTDENIGSFSAAIIRMPDTSLRLVYVGHITEFITTTYV